MLRNIYIHRINIPPIFTIVILFILIAISGCATFRFSGSSNIIETELASVQHCQYMGIVRGHSGWGNLMSDLGIAQAKSDARAAAARLSATHVVWLDIIGGYTSDVTGHAYRCTTEVTREANPPEQTINKADRSIGTAWAYNNFIAVTNYHVIKERKKISLIKTNGSTMEAKISSVDRVNDIALLKVDSKDWLPKALPIANKSARIGAKVFTVGYPHPTLMGAKPKLTDSIVSSLTGIMDDPRVYQITVPLQSGNSGGPLLNMRGEVIGMTTFKLDAAKVFQWSGDLPENVNYAIKSQYISAILNENIESLGRKNTTYLRDSLLEDLVARVQDSVLIVVAE